MLVMYSYTSGLGGPSSTAHFVGTSTGGPTYLPSSETAPQHHQMLANPLVPNIIPVGPRSCSSTTSGTLGISSLSPHAKRKRYAKSTSSIIVLEDRNWGTILDKMG